MKHNTLKSIFISLILVMGVNNAWAYNQSAVDLYFDNSTSQWSECYVSIGHTGWTAFYDMERVSGTQYLWKLPANFNGGNAWGGASGWVVSKDKWNGYPKAEDITVKYVWHGDKNVTKLQTSAWANTKIYKADGTESVSKDGTTKTVYKVTSYTKSNYTVTINTVTGGTLTVKDYDNSTIATGASKIHLTVLKFSASASTGYTFGGVQINNGSSTTTIAAADIASKTYTLTSNVTITPIWTEKTYSVTISAGNGGTVSPSGSKTIGQVTKTTVTATPNANYEFVNWTATGGVVVANTSSASTTITATAAGTLTANFRSTATNSLTVVTGAGIESVAGSTDPITLGSTYDIKATPKTGYTFSTWTANPAANATFGSATTANTTVTVKNGSVTVTASATENMSTLTTSNKYDAGDPGYEVPAASVNSIGYETTATITATTDDDYTLISWTLTNCTRTDGGANNATTITVRSNGDGKAATAVANYQKLDSVTIYFRPTNAWKEHNAWFAVYYWNDKKNGWVSMEDGDGHGNLYTTEIPGGYNNLIFVRLRPSTADGYTFENSGLHWNNQWEQTKDLTTPTDDKVLYDMESTNITHLYLTPNDNWKSDGARFAAYFFGNGEEWVDMEKVNDDLYFCDIPTTKSYPSVILCRMTLENANNNWNNKWNQTGDLTIPTGGKNLFTLNDGVWDGATETWSTIYDNSKWAIYDPEENEEEQVVYLKPTGYWSNDNPTFVAHIWNNSSNEDIPMTAIGSGYYACTIPIGYHSVVFYRKSTDGKTIWNQTSDLSIPTHRANCYTIKSTGEGTTTKATGKWNEFMLVRDYHDNQKINDITGIETVNSVITFHKEMLTNNTLSVQERALYWISFPYNVNLNDAFGFGEYGTNWIIEYYDGAERAEKGCWIEDTYWKYIEEPQDVTLEAGVGYVLALDLSTLGESSPIYNGSEQISLYFPAADDIATITGGITSTHVPTHLCEINRPTDDGDRRIKDSNWNIIGVPSFANVHDFATQVGDVNFYYQWNPTDDTYSPQLAATFQTMHAYMVQFAGTIDWGAKTAVSPAAIAARRNAASKDQYTLRLVLQQEGKDQDQTFIRLLAEGATNEFDMNVDLSKIINRGANIYSLIGKEEAAANVLPIEESIIPIGLDIEKAGIYTFAMPDGTDGITAILIDYETQTEHNLLTTEYTVDLNKGISNKRFALRVLPHHVATNIESLLDGNCNQNVQKYIINGQLFIKNNGHIYDIQGRRVK
ncbi:MAG: hypothetical protein J6A13_02475 [Paludibacteraceae bacterium]|nr:hypothetical protein [Paludibacteraceae bacterium]